MFHEKFMTRYKISLYLVINLRLIWMTCQKTELHYVLLHPSELEYLVH